MYKYEYQRTITAESYQTTGVILQWNNIPSREEWLYSWLQAWLVVWVRHYVYQVTQVVSLRKLKVDPVKRVVLKETAPLPPPLYHHRWFSNFWGGPGHAPRPEQTLRDLTELQIHFSSIQSWFETCETCSPIEFARLEKGVNTCAWMCILGGVECTFHSTCSFVKCR